MSKSKKEFEKFMNFADNGDSADLEFFGEIVSDKSRSWDDRCIAPAALIDVLPALRSKREINIRLNSPGGDPITARAIHNLLRELPARKVVTVEGWCASAATIIACAGDCVRVYDSSTYMIHNVKRLCFDYMDKRDLERAINSVNAEEQAIIAIYRAKTGKSEKKLREMLDAETWFVGKEIVNNGFADELISRDDEDDSFVVRANSYRPELRNMFFNSGNGAVKMENEAVVQKKEEKPLDIATMRAKYPEIVAEIEAEERARIQAIDEIAPTIGDRKLVQKAKYSDCIDAKELAFQALASNAARGAALVEGAKDDFRASGAASVSAVPVAGVAEVVDELAGALEKASKANGFQ